MALSKKVFEKTAEIIRNQKSCPVRRGLSRDFANFFSKENALFDTRKFIKMSKGDC